MALRPNDRPGMFGVAPPRPGVPRIRGLPRGPKYATYRKDVVVPPDVIGARLAFRKGKGYYIADGPVAPTHAPGAAPGPAATADPYAALGPYGSDYSQAAGIAKAQLDPLVAALASSIGQQTTAGIGAIKGYTGQLAQSLGGEQQQAQGIWGAAQQAQAAQEAAFAQRLSSGGEQLAGELSQRLASVNAPAATGQMAANVAQTGAGAGNAAYGTGSAAMGQLISQGASAQDYASKLPGLAQLGGIQAVRDFGLNQQKTLADASQQLLAQQPGLQNQALSYMQGQRQAATQQTQANRQYQLAAAKQRAAELQQRIETTIALGYDPTTGKLTQKAQNDLAKLRLEQRRIAVQQQSIGATNQRTAAQIEAANARAAAGQAGEDRRAAAAQAAQNARTAAQIKAANINVQKQIDAKAKNGPPEYPNLTKAQVVHLRSGIANAYYGVPEQKDANGKVVREALSPVDYQEAITEAVKAGYSRAAATKMANRFFTVPGKRGRPAKPTPDTGFRTAKVTP